MEFRPALPAGSIVLLVGVGLAALAGPWLIGGLHPENWTLHIVLTIFGLLVLGNALHVATSRAYLFDDRIEKRTLLGTQALRFAEIRRIELDRLVHRRGSEEAIRLIAGDRSLVIPALFSPFDGLRDAILARCPQAQVEDYRTQNRPLA